MATAIQEFQKNLTLMEKDFKDVLPTNIDPKKFVQVVVSAVQGSPKLLQLDRASLFSACKTCAKDGLIPDGREAALVPFKGKVKYMPMVFGVLKTIRNSGELGMIDSCVVYENDEYESWTDEKGPHFKHKKCYKDRGDALLTYAYANTKDGFVYFEEIDEEQMKKIEKCCNAENSPWKGPFKDEMKRKSALHRLSKRLPKSSDIEQVMERDNDFYDLDNKEDKPTSDEPVKSSLEKAVENAQPPAQDAEFTPEPEVVGGQVGGVVEQLIDKDGETKGKKWKKFGCKIKENWYGSFSTTDHEVMKTAKEKGSHVNINFETSEIGGKTFYNIKKIEEVWEEEVKEADVPI